MYITEYQGLCYTDPMINKNIVICFGRGIKYNFTGDCYGPKSGFIREQETHILELLKKKALRVFMESRRLLRII